MQQELGRESRFYAAISGETIVSTQIEISSGTGKGSNAVTLNQLQNTTVTLDAKITLSVGSSPQNTFIFTSDNSMVVFDTPYSNNGTLLGAVTGDYADFSGVKEAQILNFPSVSNPTFEFESNSGQIGVVTIGDWEAGDGFGAGDLLGNGDLVIEVIRSQPNDLRYPILANDGHVRGVGLSEFGSTPHFGSINGFVHNGLLHMLSGTS
jgi:hypothetical protein